MRMMKIFSPHYYISPYYIRLAL